jgi:hypothetical protein
MADIWDAHERGRWGAILTLGPLSGWFSTHAYQNMASHSFISRASVRKYSRYGCISCSYFFPLLMCVPSAALILSGKSWSTASAPRKYFNESSLTPGIHDRMDLLDINHSVRYRPILLVIEVHPHVPSSSSGIMSALLTFAVRETYAPVILRRRHARRNLAATLHSERLAPESMAKENASHVVTRSSVPPPVAPSLLFKRAITRPLRFLFTSPILILVSVFLAVSHHRAKLFLVHSVLTEIGNSTCTGCSIFFSYLFLCSSSAVPLRKRYSTTNLPSCRLAWRI